MHYPAMNTILLIEDDISLSIIETHILLQSGYHVLTASSGKEAFGLIEDWAIDLVILDINLPDMDGKTVLRRLKQIRPDIKVIITTGYEDADSYVQTIQDGVAEYLVKPVSPKRLIASVEKVLSEG